MKGYVFGLLVVGLLVGCGPKKEASQRGHDGVVSEWDLPSYLVRQTWGFPGLIVYYCPGLESAMGIKYDNYEDSNKIVVYPIMRKTDWVGFSDAEVFGDGLALVGSEATGEADVSMIWDGAQTVRWFNWGEVSDVGDIVFSKDGKQVAVGDPLNYYGVWGTEKGEKIREFYRDDESKGGYDVYHKVEGGNSGHLYVDLFDQEGVRLVDPFTGSEKVYSGASGPVYFRKDQFVYLDGKSVVELRTQRKVLEMESEPYLTKVSRDGRFLLSRSESKAVLTVFDFESGKVLRTIQEEEGGPVNQDFTVWGGAAVIPQDYFYALYDLKRPEFQVKFWPVVEVVPPSDGWAGAEYIWYMEGSDGRWAGSESAAKKRGMKGAASPELVKEFVKMVGLEAGG